jgi:serine/threonine protein kinase
MFSLILCQKYNTTNTLWIRNEMFRFNHNNKDEIVWRLERVGDYIENKNDHNLIDTAMEKEANKEEIGDGTYGVVYRYPDYQIVAKKHVSDFPRTDFIREVAFYKYFSTVLGIPPLLGADPFRLVIYLPCYDTDIADNAKEYVKEWTDADIAKVFSKVAFCLYNVNSQGICHGDVKPDNIMANHTDDVVLIDWGLAFRSFSNRNALAQSLWWRAPELSIDEVMDTSKSDIWSFGVVLLERWTDYMFPISGNSSDGHDKDHKKLHMRMKKTLQLKHTVNDILQKNKQGNTFEDNLLWLAGKKYNKIPTDAKELIAHILCIRPEDRWTWSQICECAFFKNAHSLNHSLSFPVPPTNLREGFQNACKFCSECTDKGLADYKSGN